MRATRSGSRSSHLGVATSVLFTLTMGLLVTACGAPTEEAAAPGKEAAPGREAAPEEVQTVKTATLHLVFENAVLRSPLPGVDKTAGYVTVRNVGSSDVVLTGAESDTLRAIELHTMARDGEMMRMRRLDQVTVPAGESVAFERGGKHLMIFGIEDLADSNEIVFLTANEEHLPVQFATVAVTKG